MDSLDRIAGNPFYVLGLRPGCARAEVEREGQKLIAMLGLALSAASRYATPLGPRPRTADQVRQAMAELRDPDKRLGHELWARLEPIALDEPASLVEDDRLRPWTAAPIAFGWRAR